MRRRSPSPATPSMRLEKTRGTTRRSRSRRNSCPMGSVIWSIRKISCGELDPTSAFTVPPTAAPATRPIRIFEWRGIRRRSTASMARDSTRGNFTARGRIRPFHEPSGVICEMTATLDTATHQFDAAVAAGRVPFKVRDLKEATLGRSEIRLAEHEMPGLMAIRNQYAGEKPLRGARVMGSLHMTIQTAVLIETLDALGADVRWVSCNIFSTQDHAAAAVVVGRPETGGTIDKPRGLPVFAWKGETLEEYWWCTSEALMWPDGSGPTLIVDDGGQDRK